MKNSLDIISTRPKTLITILRIVFKNNELLSLIKFKDRELKSKKIIELID